MKYEIKGFGSGTISEGYTHIKILNDIAEIDINDDAAGLLIERHGGRPVIIVIAGKPKKESKNK